MVPNFPPPDGNDFYNNGNDFYNGEPAWSPDPRPRRRTLALAGAGLAACGIIAIIVLLLTSSTTPTSTITAHTKSPGQSTSGTGTSDHRLAAGRVQPCAYSSGTNLGTAPEYPSATRSPSPTTSARKSPKRNAFAVKEPVLLCVGDNQLGVCVRDADE